MQSYGDLFVRFRATDQGIEYDYDLTVSVNGVARATRTPVSSSQSGAALQTSIAPFLKSRANQLVNNQTDLISIVNGNASNVFNAQASEDGATFDLRLMSDTGFWAEANGNYAKDGDSRTHYAFGAMGAHISLNPNFSVGGLVEIDSTSYKLDGGEMSGTGWMAGPYIVGKLPNQPVFFEARALYGETSNTLDPGAGGLVLDGIKTDRWLLQAKVQGAIDYGSVVVKPLFDASYTRDTMEGYSNGAGTTLAKESIGLGQVELGVDFDMPLDVSVGSMMLTGGISGIWSETSETYANTLETNFEGSRASVRLGMNYTLENGGQFKVGTYYDGLGASDYNSYGLNLSYGLKF